MTRSAASRRVGSVAERALGAERPALRIMFLIRALGAGAGGGAERILSLVSSALAARGHTVSLLSFDPPGGEDFYKLAPNVERIRLGRHRADGWDYAAAPGELGLIRRTAQELRPNVAVGFMPSSYVPLALALLGTRVPVVASERTSYPHYRTRPVQRMLLRASAPLVDLFTGNGEEVRKGFPRHLASRMVVVPNPVPKSKRLADPVGGATRILLSVGGLREEKDHQTLILAFARLAGSFPAWHLRIVGEGPRRHLLERQISELGLVGRVQLAGASNHVEDEYACAQLFVLPSRYEAFPNCAAEALAHGLPVVGFADCPGTNDLVLPGVNGELASGGDRVGSLSKCLERLMASDRRRLELGRAAPQIADRFSLEAIIDRWEQILSGVARLS